MARGRAGEAINERGMTMAQDKYDNEKQARVPQMQVTGDRRAYERNAPEKTRFFAEEGISAALKGLVDDVQGREPGAMAGMQSTGPDISSARWQLNDMIAALHQEVGRGATARALSVDLEALRECLPATLPVAADRALARILQDAQHARRGLR